MLLLGFPEYRIQTERLAAHLRCECYIIEVHHFPDGESKIAVPITELPSTVIICRSLDHPNDKLVELLLTSATLRDLGVKKLILVAPYLCYMRQDKAFHPGEAVSQKVIGRFLAELFDEVITVDPHLHRIHYLNEAIPAMRAVSVSAASVMGNFLTSKTDNPFLLGPDQESEQWVAAIAHQDNLEFGVAQKNRFDDETVQVILPDVDVQHREVVLVDDMVSTGHTLCEAAKKLQDLGVKKIHCLITHALLLGDAVDQLKRAGIDQIWSTDSIGHPTNVISLAELLSKAIAESTL